MFGFEINVAALVNTVVDSLVANLGAFLRTVSEAVETAFEFSVDILLLPPAIVIIVPLGLILWRVANWKIALGGTISLIFIALIGFINFSFS